MSSQRRYYPALDGARGLAALLVLLFHAGQAGLPLPSIVAFGQSGVDLFFVLSGFLITSILLAARQRDWHEVRTFYGRRSLRIFPLYYLCLVLCSHFLYPCSWPYWVYLQNIWTSTGRTISGPVHLWSLAVEEQFYLVWPFVVLFIPRRFLLTILSGSILFSFALRFWLASNHHDVYSLTVTRLDALSAGGVLATLHSKGRLERWRTLLGGLAVTSGILVALAGWGFRGSGDVLFLATKFLLLAGLYSGLVGWLICAPQSWGSRLFSVRPLRYVGRISYGLYVWHPFVLGLTLPALRNHSPWIVGSFALLSAFLVAVVSWYGYERHFLKLKDRFAPEPRFSLQAPLEG